MVNLFIVNKLDTWSSGLNNDFTLKDCLFGYIKLTDSDKYKYSGYGIDLTRVHILHYLMVA